MLNIELNKQLPVIQMNFEEVKASLIAGAAKYKGIIVTEDNLKDCKIMQKELSKTKSDLETYRKGIKKEMLIPVTKFEGQCKELVGLVVDVETPIKESIQVFDNEAKEKKKLIAIEHINKLVIELILNKKYASQLTVLDTYTNVSMSIKKVKEDIEKRGYLLQQEQQQEAENLQIIKDTIENCNKNIDAKMYIEDFKALIDANETISIVLNSINSRAERIKTNEVKAIADKAAKAEKIVQDRINKAKAEEAEKVRIEERNARIAEEAKQDTERLRVKAIEDENNKKMFERQKATESEAKNYTKEVEPPIKNDDIRAEKYLKDNYKEEKKYFIEMRVEGNIEEVDLLSKFLKENNYNYNATAKGELK
ncbi:DUF1351 domain-containing protein [Clostridium estertheticum]|uniref:DUF1351 domain-containing protein n=1 Tax=Clostridium estertheticum TaxID=238834 RepID=UPI001C7CAF1C|nr:DUF1351 domain-containing protein [Clostridium estertheticum]MBX4266586.1 DUF1351 domain-containing protein [Clostridium estertheticum]WLC88076.1 DUF1351 domain-containing protein [Clostridium estertheticum]